MHDTVRARWRRLASGGLAAITGLAAFAATSLPASAAADGEVRHAGAAGAIPGQYIVVFKDSAATDRASLQSLTGDLAARHRAKVTHTYDAALRGFAAAMDEAEARRLAKHAAVDYIAQDAEVHLTGTQSNPPSWGLDRIDQANLPLNRQYVYQNTASNVHAYIIDTGIRVSHTDFGTRASWGANFTGDGMNTDCNGHGTHVAGTVGGAKHGVAKAIKLHAVKVFSCSGGSSWSVIIAGVNWVTSNGIRPAVANMSLGGGANSAVDQAVRNSIASGVTYAIAAGNSKANACNDSPARVREAITVGATTSDDARAVFSNWGSNYGTCLDLFAPGVNITSAWHTSNTATNTISGTSMATPHAAGVAAIWLSGHPNASPSAVEVQVRDNSTVGRLSNIGTGSPNNLLFSRFIAPTSGTNKLLRGQRLNAGQYLRSDRGNHVLTMQGDGNLVHVQRGKVLWHSGTSNNPGAFAVMQNDGNFVIYRSNGTPLWSTSTGGTPADRLLMQNDGNITLKDSSGRAYWDSFGVA